MLDRKMQDFDKNSCNLLDGAGIVVYTFNLVSKGVHQSARANRVRQAGW